MKERILEFLKKENKSSAQFAEEIGVQPSGISHIISGRNNPSLDFVIKMLEKYQFLSTDWLIFGKGSMYKESKIGDLFDNIYTDEAEEPKEEKKAIKEKELTKSGQALITDLIPSQAFDNESDHVMKIVWFYKNGSFEEFYPRKG